MIKHIVLTKFFKKPHFKVLILSLLIIFFSIIYLIIDDSNFNGVNKFKETVEKELIEKKAKQEISEHFEGYINIFDNDYSQNNKNKEETIDKITKQAEQNVKKEDLSQDKIEPSLIDRYIDRIYFSTNIGCLLGSSDIYPESLLAKIITSLQAFLTVALIIY